MATPPDAALQRLGQIKGTGDDRALFLKLGAAEVLDAFERTTVFKGKTRERNIKGGKSVAFPITGKMSARYHSPGVPILGEGNNPSDINERLIELDGLMIADQVIYDLDELMNYYDVRQDVTHQLGQALAREWDKRAARVLYAAAKNTTAASFARPSTLPSTARAPGESTAPDNSPLCPPPSPPFPHRTLFRSDAVDLMP